MRMPVRRAVGRFRTILLVLGLGALCALSAHAAEISGRARVIDGDTLEIAGRRVRLFGIDAPEGRQHCTRDGKRYDCGEEAAEALRRKIGHFAITCSQRDTDRYHRVVAVCLIGDEDLGAWMTANGFAVAFRRYSLAYVGQENEAREAKRGVWRGEFEAPWDWRAHKRSRNH